MPFGKAFSSGKATRKMPKTLFDFRAEKLEDVATKLSESVVMSPLKAIACLNLVELLAAIGTIKANVYNFARVTSHAEMYTLICQLDLARHLPVV